jgi:hypothetical protein
MITRVGLEVQLAELQGKPELAVTLIRRLRAHPSCHQSQGSLHVFDYAEGRLLRTAAGRTLQAKAVAFFANQGWKYPERAMSIVWPVAALNR